VSPHFVCFRDFHRVSSITVNVISIAIEIASIVVGSVVGGFAYGFGIVYLVLSACGLYGAIVYQPRPVMAAVVGYCIKDTLMIIGLIAIGLMFDKDNRYRYMSNGKIYEIEISIDVTTLINCGVICK